MLDTKYENQTAPNKVTLYKNCLDPLYSQVKILPLIPIFAWNSTHAYEKIHLGLKIEANAACNLHDLEVCYFRQNVDLRFFLNS